ncbi:hypothetical protein GGX14DRAFT_562755 [Mycena pura]|uniref:Uncharacterized protein n=1 Tax=Mycena pura TaxID=153505 RepID=A0AAD6YI92_9AGAR|nr:hypothetical protein GGX14DRAFT_562755 [Mycena pura]
MVQLALESAGGGWGERTHRRPSMRPSALTPHSNALTTAHASGTSCVHDGCRRTSRPSLNGPAERAHANGDDDEEEKPAKLRRKKAKAARGAGERAPAPALTPARARCGAHRGGGARRRVGLDARRRRRCGTGDVLKGVHIVSGGMCTRQSMLGRPPAVLALHMNHSVHTVLRVARVALQLLDLAPYTTDGVLSLDPTAALSNAAAHRGAPVTGEDLEMDAVEQAARYMELTAASSFFWSAMVYCISARSAAQM